MGIVDVNQLAVAYRNRKVDLPRGLVQIKLDSVRRNRATADTSLFAAIVRFALAVAVVVVPCGGVL